MSTLRILGLLTGLILGSSAFALFRVRRVRRFDFVVALATASALVAASLQPALITVVRDMMALDDSQFSRLMALVILSNLVLWALVLHLRVARTTDLRQFDHLLGKLAVDDFARTYPELNPLPPVVVVVPAFNEADNISPVLAAMPTHVGDHKVIALVIDDGSDDGTADKVRAAGFPVIANPLRRGGGAALRLGFEVARTFGAQVVVSMDADGQHQPHEIAGLVQPILAGERDIVIGSRLLGHRQRDSTTRLCGIYIFNGLIRLLTSVRVSDCSNGFRAMEAQALGRLLLQQDQFHTSELIIDAARKGLRIGEAPVSVLRRSGGTSKKGNNFTYGLHFARTIFKTWWR